MTNLSSVTIHCSASPDNILNDMGASEIREMHINPPFNFRDIGYHLVIKRSGDVERGRPLNSIGAHVKGANEYKGGINVGICLVGTKYFEEIQFDKLRETLDSLKITYGINNWNIFCHYQFPSARKQGKTCPNIPINNLLSWYLGHTEKAIEPYQKKGSFLLRD